MSGTITTSGLSATTTLNTNTFAGPLEVRAGTLSLKASQTGVGLGAIALGVPENDAYLIGTVPTLSTSAAGANAVFDRDMIVNNGAQTAAGAELGYSTVAKLAPLSNSTGSQAINGDITLYSPLNFQDGGGGGTGSTTFTGDVSGPSRFIIPNGRATLSGHASNDGSWLIGNTGMTAQISFTGTGSGNGPVFLSSGNNNKISYTPGALPGGPLTAQFAHGSGVPSLIPLQDSLLPNSINLLGDLIADVGPGITAEWAGPLSGSSDSYKWSAGKLILSDPASSHTGNLFISAGALELDGAISSSSATVSSSALLQDVGSLTLAGTLSGDIDLNDGDMPFAADLLRVFGSVSLSDATLDLSLLNSPAGFYGNGAFLLVDNDGIDPVLGTFAAITGLPAGYGATIDYVFSGLDSLGRLGSGNDMAVILTPEPTSLLLLVVVGAVQGARRRR